MTAGAPTARRSGKGSRSCSAWCGSARSNGELLIRKLGGETRVEYSANPGFTGTDNFTVALRPQAQGTADATVQIAATVTQGAGVAAAPAPAEQKPAHDPLARHRRGRPGAARRTEQWQGWRFGRATPV